MKLRDRQYATPSILYRDSKANIEALTGMQSGAIAFATDTGQIGVYDGTQWVWGNIGGGGTGATFRTFNADIKPDNTGSISDEFDSDTMSNWTEIDFADTATWSIQNGYMRCQQNYYTPGENRAGLVKAIPSGDFTIETHVYLSGPFLKVRSAGLALHQNLTNTGGIYVLDLCFDSIDNQWLKTDLLRFNNWSSWHSALSQVRIYQLTDAYYRIARQGSTYHFYHSSNGVGWLKMWSGTLAFTPNYFGLSISVRIDNGGPAIGFWEYFRYWNTFLDITDTTIPPKIRSTIFS